MVEGRRGVIVPGAFSALSAKVTEDLGSSRYTCLAPVYQHVVRQPDPRFMGLAEIAEHTARIHDAVSLPLIVDADTGFGNALNVRHTVCTLNVPALTAPVRGPGSAKCCGHFSGKDVIGTEEAVSKIKAAVDARLDSDLLIMAGTDAYATHGFEAAVERAMQFA